MGDVGRYSAQLVARYERKVKIKENNSDETIEKFLKSKPNFAKVGKSIDDDESTLENIINGKYIGYVYIDEDGDECDTLDNPLSVDNEEDYFDYVEDVKPLIKIEIDELRNLDLKILSEYDYYDEYAGCDTEKGLGNIYNYIYCSNDNSTEDTIKIPKEILSDLAEGKCKLVLKGDGHGSHC